MTSWEDVRRSSPGRSEPALVPTSYRSPSQSSLVARLEHRLLADDRSWWTGRNPLFVRGVAEVPGALYLNYLARKPYAASLAPGLFRPLDLPGDNETTLFTILLFTLERARPQRMPRALGVVTPRVMQSNWRFYGHVTVPGSDPRPGVLFVRTITTSLVLAAFGRRLARCFPVRRAQRMTLAAGASHVTGVIEPGPGSAPELAFEGERIHPPEVSHVFSGQFSSYHEYTRWIIDQHLSLVVWPRECIVQNMHLDFREAEIIPLRCLRCSVTDLDDFVAEPNRPFDCFVVEGLKVFLDTIHAVRVE